VRRKAKGEVPWLGDFESLQQVRYRTLGAKGKPKKRQQGKGKRKSNQFPIRFESMMKGAQTITLEQGVNHFI